MPATLSINAIRDRCVKFAYDWSDCVGDEKQDGHEFMRELMKCFGITKRKAISYERRSNRASTGRQGYIDALIPGKALIEMKSAGKDLDKAEEQALDYIHDLADVETPRLLIISDFRRIRIVDLGNDIMTADGIDSGHTEFELAKLPDHVDDLKFLAGYGMVQVGSREQEEASIRAARVMADLYEALDGSGYSDHEASIFLIRTLFCLYGDDAGLWERDLFAEFLDTRTREDGSDLGAQLAVLYQTLSTPVECRQSTLDELTARFPYVNGGIFEERLNIPSFSSAMREELVRACAFDWSGISPAVFGSLFQAVKSPEARRELGEHYTSKTNILKTLEPLFLDELHHQHADGCHQRRGHRRGVQRAPTNDQGLQLLRLRNAEGQRHRHKHKHKHKPSQHNHPRPRCAAKHHAPSTRTRLNRVRLHAAPRSKQLDPRLRRSSGEANHHRYRQDQQMHPRSPIHPARNHRPETEQQREGALWREMEPEGRSAKIQYSKF